MIDLKNINAEWSGWWSKVNIFSGENYRMLISNTKSNKLLIMYIDLDMIITGNIDELISKYRGRFSTLTTNDIFCEQTQDGYNSSIMLFEVSKKGENGIISSSVEILYETLKAYYQ